MEDKSSFPWLEDTKPGFQFALERSPLRDQVKKWLRNDIVLGLIPPGAKLRERELAEWLGISRAPVRDALMELESEGFVVSKPGGRHVIELGERDVRERYQVRLALETLAVELATKRSTPEHQAALLAKLQELEEAVADGDYHAYMNLNVEHHQLIWEQANNRHLSAVLSTVIGAFMFVARPTEREDWNETVHLHRDLVTCINSGDVAAARGSIKRHLEVALRRSLQAVATG